MKFYKLSQRKPKGDKPFLAKIKKEFGCNYYVLRYDKCYNNYVEALGEGYTSWEPDEIIGWCPLSEIEKAEE